MVTQRLFVYSFCFWNTFCYYRCNLHQVSRLLGKIRIWRFEIIMKYVVFSGQDRGTTDPDDVYHREREQNTFSRRQPREYTPQYTTLRYVLTNGKVTLDHDQEDFLQSQRSAPLCRYCKEDNPLKGPLTKPCYCRDELAHAHVDCLAYEMQRTVIPTCEVCHFVHPFYTVEVYNYAALWMICRYILTCLIHVALPVDQYYVLRLIAILFVNLNMDQLVYSSATMVPYLMACEMTRTTAAMVYIGLGIFEWRAHLDVLDLVDKTVYVWVHVQ